MYPHNIQKGRKFQYINSVPQVTSNRRDGYVCVLKNDLIKILPIRKKLDTSLR